MTLRMAAMEAGLSRSHVRDLAEAGTFPARRAGQYWIVERGELERWLAARRKPTPDQVAADFAALCDLSGFSVDVIRGQDRSQALSHQRQIIHAALRRLHPLCSYPALGRLFERNHATIMHSCAVARATLVDELVRRFRQVRGIAA